MFDFSDGGNLLLVNVYVKVNFKSGFCFFAGLETPWIKQKLKQSVRPLWTYPSLIRENVISC